MQDHCNNPAHPDQWPKDEAIIPLAFDAYGGWSDIMKDLLRVGGNKWESLNVDSGFDESAAAIFRAKHAHRIATALAVGVAEQLFNVPRSKSKM